MSTTEPRDGQDHAPSVEPHAPLVTIANPAHPSEPRVINIPLIPSDPAPKPEEMFGPAAPPGARGAPPADSVGSTPASSHAVASQDPIGTKLFLGGLNYDTEEQGLRAYFGKWGTVTDCLVLRDRETEKSRGFGFVTLSEDEAVELILREQTHEIDGRNLTVRRASHRSSGPLDNNGLPKRLAGDSSAAASAPTDNLKKVFLGGLEASMSEEVVRAACSAFGQVTDVQITSGALTPSGRGFGFVTFTTLTAANSMVTRGTIEIEGKIINIQSAQPRAASAAASSRPPMGSGMVQRPPLAGAVYGGGGMGGMGHGMSHGMGGGMAMGQGVGGAAYGHGCYGGGAMGYYGGGAMGCYGGPGMGGGAAIGGGAAMGCYGGGCGSVPGYGAAHQPSWGPSTAGSSGCGSGYGQVAYSAGGYGPMRSASHHRTGPY